MQENMKCTLSSDIKFTLNSLLRYYKSTPKRNLELPLVHNQNTFSESKLFIGKNKKLWFEYKDKLLHILVPVEMLKDSYWEPLGKLYCIQGAEHRYLQDTENNLYEVIK